MNWTKILKAVIFVGTTALLFVPFIVSYEMFFPYIAGKAYFFRLMTGLIVTAYLILAILDPEYRPKRSLICYSFFLFVVSLFVSGLLGVNPVNSFWSNFERMEGWVTIAHLFLLFVALANTFNKNNWHLIFNLSLVFNIWMLKESFQSIVAEGWASRIDMSLGNSTYLAVYALFNAFLALYLMFEYFSKQEFKNDKISKITTNILKSWPFWIYGILFVLNSVVIFQTQTRGTILGLFGGLLLIGLILVFTSRVKTFKIFSGSIIALVILAVGSIFYFKDSDFIQNNPALNRLSSISINEGTAKARILNWQIATKGVAEKPLLGWGQSNFNYVFDKYYLPEHYGNENWFDRVHNVFFDWLIAGGIFALIFYLAIWVGLLWGIIKTDQIKSPSKAILVGLSASYFFHNLFVFDQIASYIYFIYLLAFVHGLYSKKIPSITTVTKLAGITKHASKNDEAIKLSLMAVVLIVSPIVIWQINMPSYYANIELLNATKILENKKTNDGENTAVGFVYEDGLAHNLALFEKALSRDTFGNSEIRSRALMQINTIARIKNIDPKIQQAFLEFVETEMLKQIKEDPLNSRHHYLLGNFYLATGQFEKAENRAVQTIELSPTKPASKLFLLKIYHATNQAQKAVDLANEIYNMNSNNYKIWEEYIETLSKFNSDNFRVEIQNQIDQGNISWPEKFLISKVPDQPEEPQPLISLAAFYVIADEIEKATSTLHQVLDYFPEAENQINELINQIEKGESPLGKSF